MAKVLPSKADVRTILLVTAGVVAAGLFFRFFGNLPVVADARKGLGG